MILLSAASPALHAQQIPQHLPGEQSAEDVLNGKYPYPPSHPVEFHEDWAGFDTSRITKVPAPGVHPRILISPEELPDIRRRVAQPGLPHDLMENLHTKLKKAIGTPGTQGYAIYERFAAGDAEGARRLMLEKMPEGVGHYKPFLMYSFAMEAEDSLIADDAVRGKRIATAVATYAKLVEPIVDEASKSPMSDDIFRFTIPVTAENKWITGSLIQGVSLRDVVGYQLLGYTYDFAYNWMTPEQRDQVRRVISKVTYGRLWMGARLPHHFRNWNWIEIGLSEPLLALSIEGEPGYDPRLYKLGVEIARDYLTYGIDEKGSATEAVGYMNFGLVWGNPFMVAAQRRGDSLLVNSHHRAMVDWYLANLEPFGSKWTSHGDGGQEGPQLWTMFMWKYFFPNDDRWDFLMQNSLAREGRDQIALDFHVLEPVLWATDLKRDAKGNPVDYKFGGKLNLSSTFFDPLRSSLNVRTGWSKDAALFEYECRTDSVGASHEHADRGSFTFSALGRNWVEENFRSIESRYHNLVQIDGLGQGYWPGPGKWVGYKDAGWAVMAASDAKDAYGVFWPKEIITEDPNTSERFRYGRWTSYKDEAATFQKRYGNLPFTLDQRPSVVEHFKGFFDVAGGPHMWDEDSWPKAYPYNPVERAFRTALFVREGAPYVIIADDIQKDEKEHLYEWSALMGENTDIAKIDTLKESDILLADATESRDPANGTLRVKKGDHELLVRILDMKGSENPLTELAQPNLRLESIEKRDYVPNGRSWGPDKRLVIASRTTAPDFKILLFPLSAGDPLPKTEWNADHTILSIEAAGEKDEFTFSKDRDGRTHITGKRNGKATIALE